MAVVKSGALVEGVHRDATHNFSKHPADQIRILAGHGVEGDAHAGGKVQHLSRVRADPSQPNLRQVHLIQAELFDEVAAKGFTVRPGDLGENITTRGIDLLALGRDTVLRIGDEVELRVTGLRNPCAQIEALAPGLLKHVAVRTPNGIVRKAGIMCVALTSGLVRPGDPIVIAPPAGEHIALERV